MWNADKVAFKGNEYTYRAFIGNRMVWEKEFEHFTRIQNVHRTGSIEPTLRLKSNMVADGAIEDIIVDGVSVGTDKIAIEAEEGLHTIEYIFKDNTAIPEYLISLQNDYKSPQYVYIPDGVKTIGYWAFNIQSSIVDLRIGKDVTKIDGGAFYNALLKNIYCYPEVPPVLNRNPFERVSEVCTVHIKKGLKANYEAVWRPKIPEGWVFVEDL